MSHHTFDYIDYIHQQGFRVTPQRQLILDAICEGHGHTSFEEICQRVQAKSSSVSLPTIYRNLSFLCEVRLVVSLQIDNKPYYEIAGRQPHHHLICRECGKIENLEAEEIQGVFDEINAKHDFFVDVNHLGLEGLCTECMKPKTNLSN